MNLLKLSLGLTLVAGSPFALAQAPMSLCTPAEIQQLKALPDGNKEPSATITLMPQSVVMFDQEDLGGFPIDSSPLLSSGQTKTNDLFHEKFGSRLTGSQGSGAFMIQSIEAPVPEPSGIAVIGLALAGYLTRKKKR